MGKKILINLQRIVSGTKEAFDNEVNERIYKRMLKPIGTLKT